jgi:hypothetical protein
MTAPLGSATNPLICAFVDCADIFKLTIAGSAKRIAANIAMRRRMGTLKEEIIGLCCLQKAGPEDMTLAGPGKFFCMLFVKLEPDWE